MNVGVGLPTTTPGTTGELLLDWARRADEGPFSSLGVLDRIVYDSLEPFAALAAAAGVTSRVRLATMIAIGPLRPTGLLAKQAASVHALSGGRLTLGLAVGARLEDYEAAGVEHARPWEKARRAARVHPRRRGRRPRSGRRGTGSSSSSAG